MAIVSKPNVIILDEPTSGLDVESRRQVWELIRKIKVGRSIIMSSQHLEEADELADRVCIMTKGKVLTLDTPDNIKKEFGVGYELIIEPIADKVSHDDFRLMKPEIENTLKKQHIELYESSDSTYKRLIFNIPFKHVE